jgi:hypothetical protein
MTRASVPAVRAASSVLLECLPQGWCQPAIRPDTDCVATPNPAEQMESPPSAAVGARIAAVAAAVAWGFCFFGLIDLLVVLIQDDRFYDYYLLETGWGLLYTVLVAFPLATFAFRPRSLVSCARNSLVKS